MADGTGFLAELKRRHVWRVAIAYVITAWLLLQLASIVLPTFGTPAWVLKALIVLFVILFPLALVLAWAFEITPDGVRRTEPAASPEARTQGDTRAMGRKLNTGIIVALVIAVALLAGNQFIWHKGMHVTPAAPAKASAPPAVAAGNPAIPAKSIAVLPFENLSTDKGNAYFADGMQDLILTKLADIGNLKVISRTSTMQYGSHPQNLKTVGEQLGVATILEGSVQKQGNQVLINVQLIDAKTDAHIWAQTYRRTLTDVFGVEGEVAGQVATSLQAQLSPAQNAELAAVPTQSQAAYDLFLRAEYQTNQGQVNQDAIDWKAAIPLYRQAIAQDPTFALAYARLSYVESQLARGGGGGESVKQLFQQARTDAEQALKLAPDLPASQLALGYSDYYGRGDFAAALKAFNAALALRQNDADALEARGLIERRLGNFDAALASFTQAFAHNPRNSAFATFTALACLELGRYAEAESWSQRALALNPNNFDARGMNSRAILFSTGDVARALTMLLGDVPQLEQNRAGLLVLKRKYAEAIALLENIPDTPENFGPYRASKVLRLANLYRLAGDAAKARPLYAQALSHVRAELAQTQGVHRVFLWYSIADAELGLGHTAEGLSAIETAQRLGVESGDEDFSPGWMETSASLYSEAQRPDLAVPLLAKALTTPGIGAHYSPVLLWLDPAWDPIRASPQFQALLKKYAKDKPAVTYDSPAAASTSAD